MRSAKDKINEPMNNQVTAAPQNRLSDAVNAMRVNDFQKAVIITEEIIASEPNHSGAHAVQFSSLFKARKFEQARQIGSKAAQLNPKSVFILNNQACLQLEAKQPAAAATLLKSLVDQFGGWHSEWSVIMIIP